MNTNFTQRNTTEERAKNLASMKDQMRAAWISAGGRSETFQDAWEEYVSEILFVDLTLDTKKQARAANSL